MTDDLIRVTRAAGIMMTVTVTVTRMIGVRVSVTPVSGLSASASPGSAGGPSLNVRSRVPAGPAGRTSREPGAAARAVTERRAAGPAGRHRDWQGCGVADGSSPSRSTVAAARDGSAASFMLYY